RRHKASRLAAALAFYTVFSVGPLVLLIIAIAGLIFGQDAAQGKVMQQIAGVIGVDNARVVENIVRDAGRPKAGWTATVVSLATMLIGATGILSQLQDALN